MRAHLFPLQNRGMSRDLSISKADNAMAWENHNIRVTARDKDTLLSVTNERGTQQIVLPEGTIQGELIGWNVLNSHIILFTTTSDVDDYLSPTYKESETAPDFIYRIDYSGSSFTMANAAPLYTGWLGFDVKHPIESIVYFETEDIQKIYWIDGIHVLRFMNFMADAAERARWVGDDTYFDSNREAQRDVTVKIEKDWSGNNRPNGTVQYFLTYYNKHGQETGRIWTSDLVYLAPKGKGGSPDSTNTCNIVLTFSNLATGFDHVRLYSLVRTSLDGQPTAYLVSEMAIEEGDGERTITMVDSGAYLSAVDPTELLYLGSRAVIASTMTHKDQTLFLGGLTSVDRGAYTDLTSVINQNAFVNDQGVKTERTSTNDIWRSGMVRFELSASDETIPYPECTGLYPYENQLTLSSSQITTFKGGELYRFGLVFTKNDGTQSDAFWIGDAINPLYPKIDDVSTSPGRTDMVIRRPVALCELDPLIVQAAVASDYVSVTLMIAKATYADRSVKAQGIVNPTMFNLWDRYNDRLYSYSSWINRPRGSGFANHHFEAVHNSTTPEGEIQCNYWDKDDPKPWYRLYSQDAVVDGKRVRSGDLADTFDGEADYDYFCVVYRVKLTDKWAAFHSYSGGYILFTAKMRGGSQAPLPDPSTLSVNNHYTSDYTILAYERFFGAKHTGNTSKKSLYSRIYDSITSEVGIPLSYVPTYQQILNWCENAGSNTWFCISSPGDTFKGWSAAMAKEYAEGGWKGKNASVSSTDNSYLTSYYRKHIFFTDENIVTLNSPEIELEAVELDGSELDFRIIGVAKITGNTSDYVIETGPSKMAGENIYQKSFSHSNPSEEVDGLISWPLYLETGLMPKEDGLPDDIDERDSSNYQWGGGIVRYWMYMWHKSSLITGFQDEEEETRYSELHYKTYANLRYSYLTAYNEYGSENNVIFSKDNTSIRQYTALDNQYMALNVGDTQVMYDANIDTALSMPGTLKYPLFYSPAGGSDTNDSEIAGYYLSCTEPVSISYRSTAHAVIALGQDNGTDIILPSIFTEDEFHTVGGNPSKNLSPGYLPWKKIKAPTGALYYADEYNNMTMEPGDEPATETFTLRRNAGYQSVLDSWNTVKQKNPEGVVYATLIDQNSDRHFVDVSNAIIKTIPIDDNVKVTITYTYAYDIEIRFSTTDSWEAGEIRVGVSLYKKDDTYPEGEYTVGPGYSATETSVSVDSQTPHVLIHTFTGGPESPDRDVDIFEVRGTISWWREEYDPYDVTGGFSFAISSLDDSDTFEFDGSATVETYLAVENVTPEDSGQKYVFAPLSAESYVLDIASGNKTDVVRLQAVAAASQSQFVLDDDISDVLQETDKYMFIGELYLDPESELARNRFYGGIEDSAIQANTFIPASASIPLSIDAQQDILGDRGDTFFQRWDFLKTRPTSSQAENGVIDIVSAMVESHINLDGRYDNMRGISVLASISPENFNSVNPVYSQPDNFIAASDLDKDFNLDTYDSSITWTLQKADSANVDAWTHITLASSLALDGDKGKCRALRRFQNSILAFQDRGIAEVLFNSRTQLATQEGVPIEIANSGKVDGKRYISNKYGCLNKWSIIEGKNGLYFIDNINKLIGIFNGQGIDSLSSKSMFDAWVRDRNSILGWTPYDFANFVTYYDKIHSDVYFIGPSEDDPCIVYNEQIGAFTSFFDYYRVPMMTNVEDRFVSFYNHHLWLQNEGEYNNFYGTYKPYWMTWRVQPDPYGDKLWTNVEYRADFFGTPVGEGLDYTDNYLYNTTFSHMRVWDEYQDTGRTAITPNMDYKSLLYPDAQKKFRIWRLDVARDSLSGNLLDRIRNPWVYMTLEKNVTDGDGSMMQLHDVNVKYFTDE